MTTTSGESIKVEGLKSTVRSLKKFDAELVPEIKKINRAGAELIAATAIERAPVGPTGRLRKSIRAGATTFTGTVRAGGAALPYAPPIHWGWRARNIRPQPFLYEALDARRGEVLVAYEHGIGALVEKTNVGES